jgi:hypothetical protein
MATISPAAVAGRRANLLTTRLIDEVDVIGNCENAALMP